MTTCLGKSCPFGLPRVTFVNCCQFNYLVISLLVLRAGCGIWLYQFLIIAYLFTLQLFLTFHQQVKSCMFWDISRKQPRMLSARRSVIRLIALHFSRFSETVCSECGMFVVNYVSHCLLWCHANINNRHNMWMGIWRQFGDDFYIRLAGYDYETFLSVLFGNFDLIEDILDAKNKLDLYCFLTRFIHIQRLVCDGIVWQEFHKLSGTTLLLLWMTQWSQAWVRPSGLVRWDCMTWTVWQILEQASLPQLLMTHLFQFMVFLVFPYFVLVMFCVFVMLVYHALLTWRN